MELKHPFTCIIAGPSGSGKTVFTVKLLKFIDQMIDSKIHEIIWCYSERQALYSKLQREIDNITFHEGLIDLSQIPSDLKPRVLIIDDLMQESDGRVVDFFTKGSHHRNLSVIFITQNFFNQGKGKRDISLNAHYVVLFRNPRDMGQIKFLARQVYPDFPNFIVEAYRDATSTPHGYLLFDFKQSTEEKYRIRSKILPDEAPCVVYLPDIKGSTRKKKY